MMRRGLSSAWGGMRLFGLFNGCISVPRLFSDVGDGRGLGGTLLHIWRWCHSTHWRLWPTYIVVSTIADYDLTFLTFHQTVFQLVSVTPDKTYRPVRIEPVIIDFKTSTLLVEYLKLTDDGLMTRRQAQLAPTHSFPVVQGMDGWMTSGQGNLRPPVRGNYPQYLSRRGLLLWH